MLKWLFRNLSTGTVQPQGQTKRSEVLFDTKIEKGN